LGAGQTLGVYAPGAAALKGEAKATWEQGRDPGPREFQLQRLHDTFLTRFLGQHDPVTETEKRNALLAHTQRSVSEQRRRMSEARAREHVGAAGWAQTSTLESIIRAGREGLAATDALRQAVVLTTEQVRTLSLAAPSQEREGHAQALAEIVHSSEEQITASQALDDLVSRALDEVARTPGDEVSVATLRQIHGRVQTQLAALSTILASARAQASTLEEVARLDRLSAEHQARVQAIHQLSAAEEAQALAEAGENVVERIAELDEASGAQLQALTRIGEAVVEKVSETGASGAEQAAALEELTQVAQRQAGKLHQG